MRDFEPSPSLSLSRHDRAADPCKTGAQVNATWGKDSIADCPSAAVAASSRSCNWRLAAQKGGDAILDANANLLIMVEGISSGGDLSGAFDDPVELTVPHKLLYAPHDYDNYQDMKSNDSPSALACASIRSGAGWPASVTGVVLTCIQLARRRRRPRSW